MSKNVLRLSIPVVRMSAKTVQLVFLSAMLLLSVMILSGTPPAHAATHPMTTAPQLKGKTIDWAHPVHVQYLPSGTHSVLSSTLQSNSVILTSSPTKAAAGHMLPNANWPTSCYNNEAYQLYNNGIGVWTYTVGNLESWVTYWWCPTYSGDSVGINWAEGRDYVLSGCDTVIIGGESSPYSSGASIRGWENPYGQDDGEANSQYYICSNTWLFAEDDSLTVPGGTNKYAVENIFEDTNGIRFPAYSPVF